MRLFIIVIAAILSACLPGRFNATTVPCPDGQVSAGVGHCEPEAVAKSETGAPGTNLPASSPKPSPTPAASLAARPSAPTYLAAIAADGSVTLKWPAVSGATSYNVYRDTSAAVGTNSPKIGSGTLSFTDSGVVNGTKYYYVVTAVSGTSESAASEYAIGLPQVAGTSGSFDTSFNGSGQVYVDGGFGNDSGQALRILNDGRLLVGGNINTGTKSDFAVLKYQVDGSPDTMFGSGGKTTTAIGTTNDVANAMDVGSDGRIVLAGSSNNGSNNDIAVALYHSDGSLDTTFGGSGFVTRAIGAGDDTLLAAGIQGDGKIVVGGQTFNGTNYDWLLMRYNVNGTLDTTFNSTGILQYDFGTGDDKIWALKILSSGKILVAGSAHNGVQIGFALARYNSNGTIDTTFGTGGYVNYVFHNQSMIYNFALQPSDQDIVVVGYSSNPSQGFAIARYTPDGQVDTTFGTSGYTYTDIVAGQVDQAHGLGFLPNGSIIVGGYRSVGGILDCTLVRYTSAGALDTTFGASGIVVTSLSTSHDRIYDAAMQADGRFVAVGYSTNASSNTDIAVLRYWP